MDARHQRPGLAFAAVRAMALRDQPPPSPSPAAGTVTPTSAEAWQPLPADTTAWLLTTAPGAARVDHLFGVIRPAAGLRLASQSSWPGACASVSMANRQLARRAAAQPPRVPRFGCD
jgi:hypothetical protein